MPAGRKAQELTHEVAGEDVRSTLDQDAPDERPLQPLAAVWRKSAARFAKNRITRGMLSLTALADEVGEHFRRVADQEGLPVGVPFAYDAFHYEHQLPGGMLSNLAAQLTEQNALDRMKEVLPSTSRVSRSSPYLTGFPISCYRENTYVL